MMVTDLDQLGSNMATYHKYNLGDSFYFLERNGSSIEKITIDKICVEKTKDFEKIIYYKLKRFSDSEYIELNINSDEFFKTKEEALEAYKNVLKNRIERFRNEIKREIRLIRRWRRELEEVNIDNVVIVNH